MGRHNSIWSFLYPLHIISCHPILHPTHPTPPSPTSHHPNPPPPTSHHHTLPLTPFSTLSTHITPHHPSTPTHPQSPGPLLLALDQLQVQIPSTAVHLCDLQWLRVGVVHADNGGIRPVDGDSAARQGMQAIRIRSAPPLHLHGRTRLVKDSYRTAKSLRCHIYTCHARCFS